MTDADHLLILFLLVRAVGIEPTTHGLKTQQPPILPSHWESDNFPGLNELAAFW